MASVLMLAQLVQRLNNLQITRVLQALGDTGRNVILTTYGSVAPKAARMTDRTQQQSPSPTLTIRHVGRPQSVTSIDIRSLVRHTRRMGGVVVMACGVGDTLLEDTVVLRATGSAALLSEKQLSSCVHLGDQRTFEQDPKYAIRLLVDIGIKALSPAINDPTTAVQAIDQLEDLLRRLAKFDLETCRAYDEDGVLRVIYQTPTWQDYLSLAFDEIRQFGSTSIQVMRRLRSALVQLSDGLDSERVAILRAYLAHLESSIERSGFDPQDRISAHVEDRQGLGLSYRHHEVAADDGRPADRIGRTA